MSIPSNLPSETTFETSDSLIKESCEQTPIVQNSKTLTGIVLADGHPVTLKGLEHILSEASTFRVLDSCRNGDDALSAVHRHRPELLLIDLNLPGKNSLTVLAEIAQAKLPVRVVIFTASVDENQICEAILLGVRGVLLKTMEPHLILKCLCKVLAGGEWLERNAVNMALGKILSRRKVMEENIGQTLTNRELQLATLVARGLCNKDAAKQLNISEGSVKVYLNQIYKKLNVVNRVALTLALQKRGLI